MQAFIYAALAWALSGLIPTILAGAGMTLIVYTALFPLVESFFNDAVNSFNGLPSVALQLVLMSGAGEALTIVGGAILTRMAITSLSNIAGLKVN